MSESRRRSRGGGGGPRRPADLGPSAAASAPAPAPRAEAISGRPTSSRSSSSSSGSLDRSGNSLVSHHSAAPHQPEWARGVLAASSVGATTSAADQEHLQQRLEEQLQFLEQEAIKVQFQLQAAQQNYRQERQQQAERQQILDNLQAHQPQTQPLQHWHHAHQHNQQQQQHQQQQQSQQHYQHQYSTPQHSPPPPPYPPHHQQPAHPYQQAAAASSSAAFHLPLSLPLPLLPPEPFSAAASVSSSRPPLPRDPRIALPVSSGTRPSSAVRPAGPLSSKSGSSSLTRPISATTHARPPRPPAASSSSSSSGGGGGGGGGVVHPCVLCRRKRRKCDGVQPTCCQCRERGVECSYPPRAKRGPIPGAALHLRGAVHQLQERLRSVREQDTRRQEEWSSLDTTGRSAVQAFLQHGGARRDTAHLQAYFFQVNNTLFPFLDRRAFARTHAKFVADAEAAAANTAASSSRATPSSPPPPPIAWIFQYAAAVAVGAGISGDVACARNAATVARVLSCAVFDAPSYDVVRAMLLLAFHLLAVNQHRRAACFLTLAKRMLFLVPMLHSRTIVRAPDEEQQAPNGPGGAKGSGNATGSTIPAPVRLTRAEHARLHETLKLLHAFLEDMLLSSAWWRTNEPDHTNDQPCDSAVASSSFFPPSASSNARDDPIQWSDLLADPATTDIYDRERTLADIAFDTRDRPNTAAPAATSATSGGVDAEFAFNNVDLTKLRGGRPGFYEFQPHADLLDPRTREGPLDSLELKPPDAPLRELKKAHETRKRKQREDEVVSTTANAAVGASGEADSSSDAADLQLNLMRVMCTLSATRGRLAVIRSDPAGVVKLHRCAGVLDESARKLDLQQASLGPAASHVSPVLRDVRAIVACMQCVVMRLLHRLDAGGEGAVAQVQGAARQATSLIHAAGGLAHNPFLGVFTHTVARAHLSTAEALMVATVRGGVRGEGWSQAVGVLQYVEKDLECHERLARRWEFARPIFAALQTRVRALVRKHWMSGATLPRLLAPTISHLLSVGLPASHGSGANTNQPGGSLATADRGRTAELSPFVHVAKVDFETRVQPSPPPPPPPPSSSQPPAQAQTTMMLATHHHPHTTNHGHTAPIYHTNATHAGRRMHSQDVRFEVPMNAAAAVAAPSPSQPFALAHDSLPQHMSPLLSSPYRLLHAPISSISPLPPPPPMPPSPPPPAMVAHAHSHSPPSKRHQTHAPSAAFFTPSLPPSPLLPPAAVSVQQLTHELPTLVRAFMDDDDAARVPVEMPDESDFPPWRHANDPPGANSVLLDDSMAAAMFFSSPVRSPSAGFLAPSSPAMPLTPIEAGFLQDGLEE